MAKKSFVEELLGYRVKVERDGKEIFSVPGFLALPGLLFSPKMSAFGIIAAPLLGCNIHLENEDGKEVDMGKAVQNAAETVIGTAKTTMKKVEEAVAIVKGLNPQATVITSSPLFTWRSPSSRESLIRIRIMP